MDDIMTLLPHQLQVQRQIEQSRAEVLNQLFDIQHHHQFLGHKTVKLLTAEKKP